MFCHSKEKKRLKKKIPEKILNGCMWLCNNVGALTGKHAANETVLWLLCQQNRMNKRKKGGPLSVSAVSPQGNNMGWLCISGSMSGLVDVSGAWHGTTHCNEVTQSSHIVGLGSPRILCMCSPLLPRAAALTQLLSCCFNFLWRHFGALGLLAFFLWVN